MTDTEIAYGWLLDWAAILLTVGPVLLYAVFTGRR